ncbi:MAG: EI24 domain-containing protein [Deltaproteobacteria bacterium]|nr:EI24 domain-containing protein [Deltaproteobacteria bacterium]
MLQFIMGLSYVVRGAGFINAQRSLLKYVLTPLLINFVLYLAFGWMAIANFHSWLKTLLPVGQGYLWLIAYILAMGIGCIILTLLIVYTFVLVGNIVASPFNDLLSEKAESLAAGRDVGASVSLRAIGQAVFQELTKAAIFVAIMLALLVINLVPVIGSVIYLLVGGLVTLFFIALQFFDYALSRRGLSLSAKIRLVLDHYLIAAGFSLGVFLVLMIPFIGLVVIPVAVVGGTLLIRDLEAPVED